MSKVDYSSAFYAGQSQASERSAEAVVPLLLKVTDATSVVDVGCGVGTWLTVLARHGVSTRLGLDGDYVTPGMLMIAPDEFRSMDLTAPTSVDRRFDLVLCLEVGEHLPSDKAGQLVRFLTSLGPVVCFSAAIPGQGGTGHVNERWPDYWAELFEQQGYRQIDVIRSSIWDDDRVAVEYAQNMILYVAPDMHEKLCGRTAGMTDLGGRRVVHPRLHEAKMRAPDFRSYAPTALARAIGSSARVLAASTGALPVSVGRYVRRRRTTQAS